MPFKVLIVGGGITGLTLAAILERYGIEYALIEKHHDLAPSLGASIGLVAHGSRVLDQLGCFDELLPFGSGVDDSDLHAPDGRLLGTHAKLGTHLDTMLGYRIFFVERQRLLRALCKAIPDESKIHLDTRFAKIEHCDEGVRVEDSDGHVFTGSILVGADGIHSRTRDEMWRLAELDNCDTTTDRRAIQTAQSCMFGTSYGLAQVKPTQTWRQYGQDRHYLCVGAPNGITFWFVFFKTRKQVDSWHTLRYTEEEKQEYAAEFSSDQVLPDLTFGDMYRAAAISALVPLEQFVLQRYYHKRIILLGDAAHKMHPITGQGGNAAIEDCALLANRLKDLLQSHSTPTDSQIQSVFHEFQEARRPRTKMLTKRAHGLAHIESFGNILVKLVALHLLPKIPGENLLAGLAESMTQGEPLKYLPLPARSKRLLPYDEEVPVAPKYRSTRASRMWIGMFLLIGSLRFIIPTTPADDLPFFAPDKPDQSILSTWQGYTNAAYLAINAFWAVESYRSAFSLGPLLTPIPWILLAQSVGWETILPAYISFWILGSSYQGFYHPWPRAMLPAAAQALPIALAVAGPNATMMVDIFSNLPLLSRLNPLTLAHLLLPVITTIIDRIITHFYGLRWEPVIQFGDHDMVHLGVLFYLAITISGAGHLCFMLQSFMPAVRQGYGLVLLHTPEVVNFVIFTLLIAVWLLFTVWDLRRVNVINLSLTKGCFYIILGLVLAGPGTTLIAAWWWRERAWERSRQRRSEERYETNAKVTANGLA